MREFLKLITKVGGRSLASHAVLLKTLFIAAPSQEAGSKLLPAAVAGALVPPPGHPSVPPPMPPPSFP